MAFGGYHPYPKRYGGHKYGKPTLQLVHESLNNQRSPVVEGPICSVETMAYARAIVFDGYGTNERAKNQFNPHKVTDMLPRWERIFGIRPAPEETEPYRRRRLARMWKRNGMVPNHATLRTVLKEELGDFFVDVHYIEAPWHIHAPDNTYPWGDVVEGLPWYSNAARILVQLQKPPGATEGEFYDAAAFVVELLDPLISAYCTFSWFRVSEIGVPNQKGFGFFLDEPANLDNRLLKNE